VRAGGGSRQDGQRAFLDEGAIGGAATTTSASLAAEDVRAVGGSREEVQKTFLVSGATGGSAQTTSASLDNATRPFMLRKMPAGNPSSASLVAAQARLLSLKAAGHHFGFEGDSKLYHAIEAFDKLEVAHKLEAAHTLNSSDLCTTAKVLNAMDLSIKRMLAARSGERVDQWSTFAKTRFYTAAQPEPVRSGPVGAGEGEEEEEIYILSEDEGGEEPASKTTGAASSSAAAEDGDEESAPEQAPPPSLASTSDFAVRSKAFALSNKSTIFCEYSSTCKRFKNASKGGPGQGFASNGDRDKHHATHKSGGCDEFGKVGAKKAK